MRIAIAQVNLTVGAVDANAEAILHWITEAKETHGAGLVVFPELAITGYPPEDLLFRPTLYGQVESALDRIRRAADGIDVLVGFPESEGGRLYNSCSYLRGGRVLATYRKRVLPNYGVFDEMRYFQPGAEVCLVDLDGVPAALSICEDLWTPGHARDCADRGAQLLININSSPYHVDKLSERRALLQRRAEETGMAILYGNLVGGQDELVFDGGTLAVAGSGEFVLSAPQFEETMPVIDVERAGATLRLATTVPPAPVPAPVESIYRALVLGVRDYVRKNGFPGVVVGCSGGIDSALTLCLAADALGAGQVQALVMPSQFTSGMSVEDSVALTANLGVGHEVISIEEPFSAFTRVLAPLFKGLQPDITEENIQARCRGLLLMAVSNKTGRMVLATGNKSEMSVGYATLYGDMAGGFAPLKDVSKTMVYRLAEWRNREREVIPRRIIERPPSAELREDQKDEDSLPPYDVLDPILERYVEDDLSPEEIIKAGFDAAAVRQVVSLVDHNEYKRRQAAPGIKISKRAFGRDRRYPITSRYRE